MSFSSQKGEFDRFFNRLDRPVEESRPNRQPDRFQSLPWTNPGTYMSLRDCIGNAKNVLFFLLCILVDRPMRKTVVSPPPLATLPSILKKYQAHTGSGKFSSGVRIIQNESK